MLTGPSLFIDPPQADFVCLYHGRLNGYTSSMQKLSRSMLIRFHF